MRGNNSKTECKCAAERVHTILDPTETAEEVEEVSVTCSLVSTHSSWGTN